MREPRPPRDDASADARRSVPLGYRAELLVAPELGEEGVGHLREGRRSLLPWREVILAVAAEVGEPQGVRTVVFDLVRKEEGGGWLAGRLDAEPGGEAAALARALDARLGSAARPSIKSLAADALPSRWYPDLESFEEAIRRDLSLG